jgi:hypothetical protein
VTEEDEEALELCIAAVLAGPDQARRRQIEKMLMDGDREEVGHLCAYIMQTRNLSLRPWEAPPCWGDTAGNAGRLVRRLRAAGVSIYHPDPLEALNGAE